MPAISKSSTKRLAIVLFACALFGLLFVAAQAQDDIAAQVLRRINRAREEANLPPLARNGQLDAAAQGHANDILQNGSKLGHRGSDGSNIRQRIARAGYNGDQVGENWAGYRTLDKIMDFWMNDPPHRKNILHTKYSEIGIGVATRPNGGIIVVTDFGSPKNQAQAPQAEIAPQQAKPTQSRPKPTAKPKPTQVPPTPKPTRKPTQVPTAVPTLVPTQVPTVVQVALAQPPAPKKIVKPLRVRGKAARLRLTGEAWSELGKPELRGDPVRQWFGGSLAVAGALLLGVAIIGHHRRRRW